jgi:hypothetical protein
MANWPLKTQIGKVDEILGPINQVYFTVKPQDGIVATSFKAGDKVYIGGDKLLPLEKSDSLSFCFVSSLTLSSGSSPSPRLPLVPLSPSVPVVLPVAAVASVLVVVPPVAVVDSVLVVVVASVAVVAVASVVAVVLPVAAVASAVAVVLPAVVVASVVADTKSVDHMYCLLMAFGGYGSFFQEYLFRLLVHPAQLQLNWLQAVEYHQSKNLSVQIFKASEFKSCLA